MVGGPFNGFTGYWHLTGTFVPAKGVALAHAVRTSPLGALATWRRWAPWPRPGSTPARWPRRPPSPLVGTFSISPGSCSGGAISGTYLRMVLSGGTNAAGPYFSNSDSSCADNSFTPLAPGSAGGLVTGGYQAEPSPAFDGSGNALAAQITRPVAFEGVKFATATNPVDPQTGQRVPAPAITATGGAAEREPRGLRGVVEQPAVQSGLAQARRRLAGKHHAGHRHLQPGHRAPTCCSGRARWSAAPSTDSRPFGT